VSTPELRSLLTAFDRDLDAFVRRHAGWLLRYESADDLRQGLQLRALENEASFRHAGEKQTLKWLYTVARTYLADRADYWSALKRRPSRLLRLTFGATPSSDPGAAAEPAGARTGPSTFASRREELTLAVRVLGALLPRDRDLVKWSSEGVSIDEMAQRLDVSYAAAQRAQHRALERFRAAYTLAAR